MNIFERLYNKVFHNEALITEDKLEDQMFSELEDLSKKPKFLAFQKAEKMVNCIEKYLGEIVKNRGNLWTGRNKVSKFLGNIQNKGSIEDKVCYLAEITRDKEFGGSYWAQKIGPIFSEVGKSLHKYHDNEKERRELLKKCDVASALEWLERCGGVFKRSDFMGILDNIVCYYIYLDDGDGKYIYHDLEACYTKVIKHIESYILCVICCTYYSLKNIISDLNDIKKLGCGNYLDKLLYSQGAKVVNNELGLIVNFYQEKRRDICQTIIKIDQGDNAFISCDYACRNELGRCLGFWSKSDVEKKSMIERIWNDVSYNRSQN